jgi:alcohol dehydrogenase class IV
VTPVRFSVPTRIVAGLGARAQLDQILARIDAWPVAVVVDRGVYERGLLDRIVDVHASGQFVLCARVEADPTVADAEAAARDASAAGCRAVLAVGGGSALGAGKAVALRITNREPIAAYAGRDRAPERPAPCVAVPTIAGSGSEVSNALVLRDAGERVTVVRGDGYEPDVAILDAELLSTLPETPMLHAALDGLSHALEALWVQGASRYTDALAHAAAAQIGAVLPAALAERRPGDVQALLEAGTMANLACGPSGLGLAHALASATSVRLPHGYQTAVLLPHVAAFHEPVLDERAAATVVAALDVYDEVGFEARFAAGEISAVAAEAMVTAALGNPFRTNDLRLADSDELRAILAAAGAEVAATTLRSTT